MRSPFVAIAVLVVGCNFGPESIDRSNSSRNRIPIEASDALRDGHSFELLSLDPTQRNGNSDAESFHNWVVLGVAPISDASIRAELLDALDAGVAENDGIVAACFDPRHGIRVVHNGKLYEFVICFECYAARWYTDGDQNKGFLTTGRPQQIFDRVLIDVGIDLPPPAE